MNNDNKEFLTEYNEEKIREEIYAIEVRLQELDAILEKYEDILYERNEETLPQEEVEKLVAEYHDLKKRKKDLAKSLKKSKWDMVPLWMAVYAVVQFIFSFYVFQVQISLEFARWLTELIYSVWKTGLWVFYTSIFLLPVLSLLVSLIIWLKLKNKDRKKIFRIIFLIHSLETIGTLVYFIVIIAKTVAK